jgi:excinuclease ABC subunit C
MLLQKIRDEAHRFAITFNRTARSKAMKRNILEELPGFGPTTRKKLLKLAGSIDSIAALSRVGLNTVCTVPQMETLIAHGLWSEKNPLK